MKEIKFRYVVKRENGYIFTKIFTLQEIEFGDVTQWKKVNIISNDQIIAKDQFTGLRDKNRKAIYKGDIIKFYTDDKIIILPVYFNAGCFMIDFSTLEGGICCLGGFPGTCEVLGNIHENPELLK